MEKPNIIFLLNDHMAYYDHGEMAGGPKIKRPNFERLAAEGVKFTLAYTACPLCGPARRSMLTGLFPHNHREIKNDTNHPFDRETYLDKLAEAGYKNYYFGKWHAGPGTAHDHQCEGFSYESYNNPYTKPEYKEYLKKNDLPQFQVRIQRSFWPQVKVKDMREGKLYTPSRDWCNEHATGIMTTPKETHEAFFLASLACDKLTQISTSGIKQPFHLRVDFWGPHQPYFASQEYLDLYDPESILEYPNFRDDLKNKPAIYRWEFNLPLNDKGKIIYPNPLPWPEWQKILALNYAQQTLIDEAGGLILKTLDDLGFADNTLVVWTADHGDAVACHGGHFDKNFYMPEEMVHIPMVIKYPNKIPAGLLIDELVSNLDLPPTFLDVAGTGFDDSIDGQSLLPLSTQKDIDWRDDLMCQTHGHAGKHLGRLIVTDRYKYVWNDDDMDELYDLKDDPYELSNLMDNKDNTDILEDMKTRLGNWREKTNDRVDRRMLRKNILRYK